MAHPELPRSKYHLTGRLGELDEIHQTDLKVQKEIHVLELMIAGDLERLPEDCPTPRQLVRQLVALDTSIDQVLLGQDPKAMRGHASGLRSDIEEVTLYWQVMDGVRKNMDLRRKMIDTHVRQLTREYGPVDWYDVAGIMEEMRRDVREIIELIDDPAKKAQAIKRLQSQTERERPSHLQLMAD